MVKTNLPLVTFFLFSYNQEQYIKEACHAALAQDYTPLEVIFSDDCSTDKTFEIIENVVRNYCGPHRVILNKNKSNLGLIGHVNKSFEISSGDLIVAAAGDDISAPNRVRRLMDAYFQSGKCALLLHSSAIKINDYNDALGVFVPPVIEQPMSNNQLVGCLGLYIGATGAWSRAIYKKYGPILYKEAYEDLVLGFRAAINRQLVYVDAPLVRYRIGVGINTQPKPSWFSFPAKIEIRKKMLRMALDVYEQRLRDVACTSEIDPGGEMQARLIRNIEYQKSKLTFYNNPIELASCLLSKKIVSILRAFYTEIPYLLR